MGTLSTAALYALCTVGQALVLVMVPLRCIARLRVVYRLAFEDYLMMIAGVSVLGPGPYLTHSC